MLDLGRTVVLDSAQVLSLRSGSKATLASVFLVSGKVPTQSLLKRKTVLCVCEPVQSLTTVYLSLYAFIFLFAFTVPAVGAELVVVISD